MRRLASLAGILLLCATACNHAQAGDAPSAAVPVTVATAVQKPMPAQITAMAQCSPSSA
jgi:hypothetical protein